MLIESKFKSICPICGRTINIGDSVFWWKGSKAYHEKCPDESIPPIEPGIRRIPASTYDDITYKIGTILQTSTGDYLTVVRVWRRHQTPAGKEISEERGYICFVDCRDSTDNEVGEYAQELWEKSLNREASDFV